MTAFSYSTGNPTNLVGGGLIDFDDISNSFADVATYLNSGAIDSGAVVAASITDAKLTNTNLATWLPVYEGTANCGTQATTTTSFTPVGTGVSQFLHAIFSGGANACGGNGSLALGSTTLSGPRFLWAPPSAADADVSGKTTKFRLRIVWMTNATAPGVTLNWGLYPITAMTGAASLIGISTVGSVLAGTVATATTPSANTAGQAVSTGISLASITGATLYCVGCTTSSGTQAANSLVPFHAYIERSYV